MPDIAAFAAAIAHDLRAANTPLVVANEVTLVYGLRLARVLAVNANWLLGLFLLGARHGDELINWLDGLFFIPNEKSVSIFLIHQRLWFLRLSMIFTYV